MEDPCILYKSQYKKAKETLDILEKEKEIINLTLESNPSSASWNKKLRDINMDIKITMNEIEHSDFNLQNCEIKYNSTPSLE